MMSASNIHYELGDRVQGLAAGGIGAMLLLARKIGLISEIDRNLHLLKRHLPYHESDHVLNIAFNILAGGKRIEHLELRRNDEVYLNALGAERIPDPTTTGSALLVPVLPQHEAKHKAEKRSLLRMEFATFCAAFIEMPCQIIKGARRLIYRLLSWNPWQEVFLRLVERLHGSLLC